MNTKLFKSLADAVFCIGLLVAVPAYATGSPPTVLYFQGITDNDTTGNAVADGMANLRADVLDIGVQSVRFLFTNGSNVSSLTDVYFADGALFNKINRITASNNGVVFSQGATPKNLPGGNGISVPFLTTAGFSADSDPPVSLNGVQNSDVTGEWLAIDFLLKDGKTFADVLFALTLPAGGDWLRVGLHVQSFAGGYSESFINKQLAISPVPEPATYGMMAVGLCLLGFAARRRKQDKTA